jgi:HME family heavy-metal exporter
MSAFLNALIRKPILTVMAVLAAAVFGWCRFSALSVDVFPDIAVPRVVVQTEAAGLTAEEVEQRVTIPIESAMNGIPGVSIIRSSSSGGLSFVWVEFDWNVDLTQYDLIIHCGACMFSRNQMLNRIEDVKKHQIKITNYGITIAYLNDIINKIIW